jgi:hypothetical protein
MEILPPLEDNEVPAYRITSPPDPLCPRPTVIYTDPPRPELADPVPNIMAPAFPLLEVPVLRTRRPLTPAVPAFAVCKRSSPLEVALLNPVVIDTRPPVESEVVPEERIRLPLGPLFPEPTVM